MQRRSQCLTPWDLLWSSRYPEYKPSGVSVYFSKGNRSNRVDLTKELISTELPPSGHIVPLIPQPVIFSSTSYCDKYICISLSFGYGNFNCFFVQVNVESVLFHPQFTTTVVSWPCWAALSQPNVSWYKNVPAGLMSTFWADSYVDLHQ